MTRNYLIISFPSVTFDFEAKVDDKSKTKIATPSIPQLDIYAQFVEKKEETKKYELFLIVTVPTNIDSSKLLQIVKHFFLLLQGSIISILNYFYLPHASSWSIDPLLFDKNMAQKLVEENFINPPCDLNQSINNADIENLRLKFEFRSIHELAKKQNNMITITKQAYEYFYANFSNLLGHIIEYNNELSFLCYSELRRSLEEKYKTIKRAGDLLVTHIFKTGGLNSKYDNLKSEVKRLIPNEHYAYFDLFSNELKHLRDATSHAEYNNFYIMPHDLEDYLNKYIKSSQSKYKQHAYAPFRRMLIKYIWSKYKPSKKP